jgi:hypothetical protein
LGKILQIKLDELVLQGSLVEEPMIDSESPEQPLIEKPIQSSEVSEKPSKSSKVSAENPEFVDYTNLQSILAHYSHWTPE